MGTWYKNLTILGPSQSDVAAALVRLDRRAYVTPTRGHITVVFDHAADMAGDPTELGDLALSLSTDLSCVVLAAAVFDDDVLLCGLYDRGAQVGEYSSSGPSTLGALALAKAFRVSFRTPLVWLLLKWPTFVFESFRHRTLILALRHPVWAYATGYNYIHKGELPDDLGEAALVHVGGSSPPGRS